jgi:hypothetical protein
MLSALLAVFNNYGLVDGEGVLVLCIVVTLC